MKKVIWVIVTLFLLAVLSAPLLAQDKRPSRTGCQAGVAYTEYRDDIQRDSLEYQQLEAHESVHRAQITEMMTATKLSCEQILAGISTDPEIILALEIPALRAQADWLEKHYLSFDRRQFYLATSKWLFFNLKQAIPVGVIFSRLNGTEGIAPYGEVAQ